MLTLSTCEWSGRCNNFSIRGVVEKLQAITAPDERTPIGVEISGKVDVTKVSKQ